MDVIFTATPKDGKLIFSNADHLRRFCLENDGTEQTVTMKATAKTSEKQRMYAFIHGPVLATAVRGFTRHGYDGIDKEAAKQFLKKMFANSHIYNSKSEKYEIYTMSLSRMNKAELLKFLQDCLFFIEKDLDMEVPDAAQYRMLNSWDDDQTI